MKSLLQMTTRRELPNEKAGVPELLFCARFLSRFLGGDLWSREYKLANRGFADDFKKPCQRTGMEITLRTLNKLHVIYTLDTLPTMQL